MKRLLIILAFLFTIQGCVPAIIASATYAGVKGSENKQKFITELNTNNTKREAAGLPPLDTCDELYKAKPSWAYNNKQCNEKYPKPAQKRRK